MEEQFALNKALLERLNRGETLIGTHITCNDPLLTELIGNAGFDYLWIDTEHTYIEKTMLINHLIAARACRIPWNDQVLAKPILDMGADGLIFPMIKTPEDAAALAKTMVEIGVHLGKKTAALITDMNQPLGSCIGNALDVREAIEILQGKHQDSDLFAICKRLSAQLIRLGGKAEEEREAERMVLDAIASGRALQKLATMIQAQGGDARVCQDTSRLPSAERIIPVLSQQAGYIAKMDTQSIGTCAQMLGAGREKLGDKIDPAVGIVMKKRVGDFVRTGDVLAEFHVNEQNMLQEAMRRFSAAFAYSKKPVDPPKLVYGLVDEQGLHDE